jgi:hypothetical protein
LFTREVEVAKQRFPTTQQSPAELTASLVDADVTTVAMGIRWRLVYDALSGPWRNLAGAQAYCALRS